MTRPPASVQLYTVREQLAADPATTLQRLAGLGLRAVEPYGLTELVDQVAPALEEAGLTAPTAHATVLGADLNALLAAAGRTGTTTIIDPFIPDELWTTREQVAAIAARLTDAAERAADHGVRIGYHNHWWELERRIDGAPALEVFADHLSDRVVLEVDTYWSAVGGVDPVGLLERLGERVVALHIKDGPVTREVERQLPAGSGELPIAAILAAAPQARPVIEFDAYAGDLFDGIAESIRFVRTLGVEL